MKADPYADHEAKAENVERIGRKPLLHRLDGLSHEVARGGDVGLGVIPPDFALTGALAQMKVLRAPADKSSLVSSLADRAKAKGIAGDWARQATSVYEQKVLPALDRRSAACCAAMAGIYQELLGKIATDPEIIMRGRASLTTGQKLRVAGRGLVRRG